MSELDLFLRVAAALLAGGVVGLERTYRGRAAGLRTYALVCFGSALLVATTQFAPWAAVRGEGDTTRVIQGIVTGIGFLGAGVIVKEGFSVRGLTTAASIWVISAIGVVFGGGAYVAGVAASALTLVALALLRRIEDRIPVQYFAHCQVALRRAQLLDENWLRGLVERHGYVITEMSYQLEGKNEIFEFQFVMWTTDPSAASNLSKSFLAQPEVADFRISPSRD